MPMPGIHIPMLGGAGSTAFPVVVGTALSTDTSGAVKTISLPSSIPSGRLILIQMVISDGKTVSDWDTTKDFTEIFQETFSNDITLATAYRIADGTEGATIDVTLNVAKDAAALVYHISGAKGTAPEGA